MLSLLRSNLGRRIMLLVGMSMLLMIVTLTVSGWLAVKQNSERVAHERQALAQVTASQLDYILRQNLARLDGVQFVPGVDIEDNDLDPEKRALHSAYLGSIFDDGVFIADSRGTVLWSEPYRRELVNASISKNVPVSQSLGSAKPFVSNVALFQPGGRSTVLLAMPLRNSAGKIVGMVGGQIDPNRATLREFISDAALGKTSHIDIIDGASIVLASTDPARILATDRNTGAEVAEVARLSAAPWTVAVKQSRVEALAPVQDMTRRLVIFGFLAVLLAFFFSWGMARSLLKPIAQLTAAARRISKGDLSQPVPYLGSDEISELGSSFDTMRITLNRSLDEIKEYNRQLEAKVEERTHRLEESYREIERKEAARGELLRRILSVQEEERKRIARELHDETTQSILALVMRLEAAGNTHDELPPRVKNLLADIKGLGTRTLDSVHRIIFDLRPSVLDDLGLLSALRWLAQNRLEPLAVKARVEVTGEERKLPPPVEIALFRVVQEAFTNIARHADAHNVVLSVEFRDSAILIDVEDDGKGFDMSAISHASEAQGVGLGLMGMQERIELLGGKFRINSHPGEGTHLGVEVPLA